MNAASRAAAALARKRDLSATGIRENAITAERRAILKTLAAIVFSTRRRRRKRSKKKVATRTPNEREFAALGEYTVSDEGVARRGADF